MKTVLHLSRFLSLLLFFFLPLFSKAQLEGVWKPVSMEYNGQDTSYKSDQVQPGLIIFTEKYYSIAQVMGQEARPLLPEDTNRNTISDEELRTTFWPYVSNSGVYTVSGNSFTTKPMVALWPNFMEGGWMTFTFRMENNAFYLSYPDGLTIKFLRVE